MKSSYKKLGEYIREVNIRNMKLNDYILLGVSVSKEFIPSIANTVGTDFSKYKIVKRNQFTYIPDTSRRGDKIGIALLSKYDNALVSQAYTVFEIIKEDELLPEYLMMWFRRPEFDRYARFKSEGSVREIFSWKELCDVELPIPDIEKQRKIVQQYNQINEAIKIKEAINNNLEEQIISIFNLTIEQNKNDIDYCKLEDLCDIKGGKRLPLGDFFASQKTAHPYIRVRDLNNKLVVNLDNTFEYIDETTFSSISNYIVKTDDVLISIVGTIGLTAIVNQSLNKANLTENCVKLTNFVKVSPEYIILFLRSNMGIQEIQNGIVGAVQAKLPIKNIAAINVPISKSDTFNNLYSSAKRIFSIISNNQSILSNLHNMRDILLPKLMLENCDSSSDKLSFI